MWTTTLPTALASLDPLAAQGALRQMLKRMVTFIVGSAEAGAIVPFMLREITEDGPGVDNVYTSLIEPAHRHFCTLLAQARGMAAESEEVKLTVFSLIGQVLYFCIGARVVSRRMGWQDIGPAEIDKITKQLLRNLDAVLAAKEA